MISKTIKKIFFVSFFLLYFITHSMSQIITEAWGYQCNSDNTCYIAIKNQIKTNENKEMQTIATAFVQIGLSKQKKMNLINEDDQTYKLTEENKNIPVLFVNLPLGTDLQKQPLIKVDGKNLGNLFYNTCNNIDGCRTNVAINENIIDLFKKGKNMTVVVNIFGSSKNFEINFPLKNFSKSYTKLLKK